MANDPRTIARLTELLAQAGAREVHLRKMFGEVAVYLGAKVVAFVCEDRLFLKPTPGARTLLPEAEAAPPYPGARPHLAADAAMEDAGLLWQALQAVAADLPEPPPKPGKRRA